MHRSLRHLASLAAVLTVTLVAAGTANANHAWNGYHWSRPANPFTVTFANNLDSGWSGYLTQAAADWSLTSGACNNPSNPVRCTVVAGGGSVRGCRPATGEVKVCNSTYGNTGWLGLATIWVSGNHITKGSVKVNDTYFASPPYNIPAWHSAVMDQEVGHTFGLAHQDENFNNPDLLDACGRGSCMDYSADPSNNTTPNGHDYDELVTIYSSHLDGAAALAMDSAAPVDDETEVEDPSTWGQAMRFANGHPILFERDLGGGNKKVTFVIWAQ
ncbi:MAG TPA: hypothetical protein VGK89_05780 [Candidatus Eisenbacteria bacterium]|jgi:hypothetical protein